MAWAQVQKNETEITSGASTVTTTTCVLTGVATGNLLVAFGAAASGSITLTFSDNNSNSWSTAVTENTQTNGPSIAIGYAPNSNSGDTTITLTRSGGTGAFYLAVMEYSGGATSTPLDQNSNAKGTSTSPSSGSITTTEDAELLIGGYGQSVQFSGGDVFTVDGGWTLVNELGTAAKYGKVYEQLEFATGTTDFGGTIAGTREWVAIIASFKPSAGDGGGSDGAAMYYYNMMQG